MLSFAIRQFRPVRALNLRFFTNNSRPAVISNIPARNVLVDKDESENIFASIRMQNPRLENLNITAQYYAGHLKVELPSNTHHIKRCPTTESNVVKRVIVEVPKAIKEPEVEKKVINDPLGKRSIKKHAIRMIVLRRRKMKKHQFKKLWQRMYLKFRARRQGREKAKEYEFRGKLAAKVNEARRFSAEQYVEEYLTDYHTPLLPKTYQGKRLPAWLIKELMEEDRQFEKEKTMMGKDFTTAETIVKPKETVKEFISRTWKTPQA